MMKFRPLISIAAFALSLATSASAQSFTDIRDAAPNRNFSATTSSSSDGVLTIGLDTGYDPSTFVNNTFRASNLSYFPRSTSDTIAFVVTAPSGSHIATITYSQSGVVNSSRTAVQRSAVHWTVGGFPSVITDFGAPNLSATVDVGALNLSSVPVSITAALFVGPTGDIQITSASVTVTLAPDVQSDGSLVSILD